MVQEATAEPQVLETQVETSSTEATTEAEATAEVDYKAEYEKSQAQITELGKQAERLEHQLATNAGVLKQRLDIEAALGRVYRRMDNQNEILRAFVEGQARGEPEKALSQLDALKGREMAEEAQGTLAEQADMLLATIRDDVLDSGLNDTAPEFEPVRALWARGLAEWNQDANDPHKRRSMTTFHAAVRKSAEIRREAQKTKLEAQLKDIEDKANEKLRKSGVVSMPVPSAAGRGTGSEQELVNRLGRGEAMTTDEMVKANAAMAKGIYPKR